MPYKLEQFVYQTACKIKMAWFLGHYTLAMLVAPKIGEAPREKLPSWPTIYSDLERLLHRDWQNISDGLYPSPAFGNPIRHVSRSIAFFRDLGAVTRRRAEANGGEIFDPALSSRFPRYYLQNFHYQSGGYLTAESAKLYEHQVEVLFVGGAELMRRQALASIIRYLQKNPQTSQRHLDVACGTGSFLAMLKEARPRLEVTGVDLSQPYLVEAHQTLKPWSRTRLTQANAELLPYPSDVFDTISCLFLFHELPAIVRQTVADEIARVLKPRGRAFFLDSIQIGDRPEYDALLTHFPNVFHEPYYQNFIESDLTELFKNSRLNTHTSELAYFAKLLILEK